MSHKVVCKPVSSRSIFKHLCLLPQRVLKSHPNSFYFLQCFLRNAPICNIVHFVSNSRAWNLSLCIMQRIATIALFTLLAAFVHIAMGNPTPPVPKKHSAITLETIMANDHLLTSYIRCMLDQGPCTRDGNNLKALLPDAIQTDCHNCTRMQKLNSRKVISFLRTRRPQDWRRLTERFDPKGLFKARN